MMIGDFTFFASQAGYSMDLRNPENKVPLHACHHRESRPQRYFHACRGHQLPVSTCTCSHMKRQWALEAEEDPKVPDLLVFLPKMTIPDLFGSRNRTSRVQGLSILYSE